MDKTAHINLSCSSDHVNGNKANLQANLHILPLTLCYSMNEINTV